MYKYNLTVVLSITLYFPHRILLRMPVRYDVEWYTILIYVFLQIISNLLNVTTRMVYQ